MKKIVKLLLYVIILGNIFYTVNVHATENADELEVVQAQEAKQEMKINPIYTDKVNESDSMALHNEWKSYADTGIVLYSEDTYCDTLSEAHEYIKEEFIQRENIITFYLASDVITEDVFDNLWNGIFTYSDSCSGQEGDAMRFSWKTYSASYSSVNTLYYRFTYSVEYDSTLEQEQALTEKAAEILTILDLEEKTEYEKIKEIYTYICDNVDYDYSYSKYSGYDALCTGSSVCEGYAKAFYRLSKDAGLSVRIVTGTGNGGAHAWNIVRINNVYYNVDATWDGQDSETRSNYFLKNEEDFRDHVRDAEWNTEAYHNQFPMTEESWIDYSTFAQPLNKENLSYYFQDINGNTISSIADSKPKILIFFSVNCGNSSMTIQSIAESNIENVDVFAITASEATIEETVSFKNNYGNEAIVFSCDSNGNAAMWDYLSEREINNSIYYPVIVYIDSDNNLQAVDYGLQDAGTIKAYLKYYCSNENDLIENPFSDVSESMYYYEPVLWALENNVTAGLTATEFAPEAACTRGQVVTFLWRAMGKPEPSVTKNPFVDVRSSEYYYKPILWALENGITAGLDATHFAPEETVTRGQFVTFLHRAMKIPNYTVDNPFEDIIKDSYYYDAVLWAYENNVTAGLDATHFAPEDYCSRGQVVTFLYRVLNKE